MTYAMGTWVRPLYPETDWPTVPGIVESTRNIFCESIPDYQRVNVVWPESGHRMEAAARFFAPAGDPRVPAC
jgi:hypothetical protein